MREISLDECHERLLKLGMHFHDVCVKNGIPYYMTGGTMLGAVRHKGFIPWDDDMDFCVPRKYFEKLLDLLEQSTSNPYKVWSYRNAKYPLFFIKIEDSNTWIDDPQRVGHDNLKTGLFIDIFPLEQCSSELKKVVPYIKRKQSDTVKIVSIYLSYVHNNIIKNLLQKVIRLIYKKDIEYWLKRDKWIVEKVNKTGNDAVVNLSGIYGEREVMKKEFFGEPTLYAFESTHFYGVQDYHSMLSHIYNNYMLLPPEDKRHYHANSVYVIY